MRPHRLFFTIHSTLRTDLPHQAIKALAPSLAAMGTAADGIVEAVYMPGKRFVWAVQWHPEFLWRVDENSRKLFAAFVRAAGGR